MFGDFKMSIYICINKSLVNALQIIKNMKTSITLLAIITLFSANSAIAQKRIVENAAKVAALVPAKDAKVLVDRKACAITNKSADRTITVRIEESVMVNDYLQKRIKVIEKIGPKEQKFVGYAGCEANVLGEKCAGYKILLAYYDDARSAAPQMTEKATEAVAALK